MDKTDATSEQVVAVKAWLKNWHKKATKPEFMHDDHYENAARSLLGSTPPLIQTRNPAP